MKKFNITSEKLGIIVFTTIQILCVFIAAAFALQEPTNIYSDAISAIEYLCVAIFFEWVKYKITHPYKDDTQG